MKKGFAFLSLIALTILISFNGDQRAVLNYNRVPAASVDCAEVIRSFLETRSDLRVEKNSLFARYPQLKPLLLKTEFTPLEIPEFYRTFIKDNNRPPTIREAMEYIYLVRREIIASYDEIITDIESMNNPALSTYVEELKLSREKLNKFKDLDIYDEELSEGKSKITSIDETITAKNNQIETRYLSYLKERSREGMFYGEFGELLSYGSSKDIPIKKGLKIETRNIRELSSYQQLIAKAVDKFEASLAKKTDEELVALVNKHGEGLLRGAKAYLDMSEVGFNRDVLITKILTMIRTKEIDLVFQKSDGKYVWAEVKAYKKPITADTLNGNGFKAKPMVDQLREHIALRDLLGLKSTVTLRFITPISHITPEAKQIVEKMGFEVVSAQ